MEAKQKGSKEEVTSSAKTCKEGKIRTKKSRQICHLGRLWCLQKNNGCHQGAPLPLSRRDRSPRGLAVPLCGPHSRMCSRGGTPPPFPLLGRGWEPRAQALSAVQTACGRPTLEKWGRGWRGCWVTAPPREPSSGKHLPLSSCPWPRLKLLTLVIVTSSDFVPGFRTSSAAALFPWGQSTHNP